MTSRIVLSATALVMGVAAVSMPAAADRLDRTDVRQYNQAKRIEQGIRSGELTRAEAEKLKHEQGHIRELKRRAERDGHLTRAERARIEAAQDAASRSIYNEKHDAQNRDRHYGGRHDGYRHHGDHHSGERRWFHRFGHNHHGERRWFHRFGHNHHGERRWYRRWF